ncbi:toll/interleukin-1 receptor domain-containing protein, partial [Frankia sp. CiP1_Cm_nod2]|uniref:toll/interleukin-1 receptor domain-containing protein n=1 Tax=Frankia sp. CiP1_Cm_nod2 TaxID=2897161 RepID=UPI0020245F8F
MGDGGRDSTATVWDFFVSYTRTDQPWAEWIAEALESDGHRVLVQAWDFVPGSNWPALVHAGVTRGGRLLAVLSPAYLDSVWGSAEWQAMWAADPAGDDRRLIPVRIAPCDPKRLGLVGTRGWIDLTDLSGPEAEAEATARTRLLDGVRAAREGRVRPTGPLLFPARDGDGDRDRGRDSAGDDGTAGRGARYPGRPPAVWGLPAHLPRNPRFTGREGELAELRERLTRSGQAAVVPHLPVGRTP